MVKYLVAIIREEGSNGRDGGESGGTCTCATC